MKPFAAAVLLVLLALPAAAQPAPRAVDPLLLYSPSKGSVVKSPTVLFTWAEFPSAVWYLLTVQNVDGSQAVSQAFPNAGCDGSCTNSIDLELSTFVWNEGAIYKWQVSARDDAFEVIAKSKKWSFTVDMLKKIVLRYPADGETVTTVHIGDNDEISVDWTSATPSPLEYVASLYNKSGTLVSAYYSVPELCSTPCTATFIVTGNIQSGQTKTFYWKVVGTHEDITGKAKSPKFKVKIYQP